MAWSDQKENIASEILKLLYEARMIRTFYRDRPEGWTLMSGIYSPLYIQLRPLLSYPDVFRRVCEAMCHLIKNEVPQISKLVGIAMAGVPLVAGMAVAGGMPATFTRKMEKVKSVDDFRTIIQSYGEHALIEGEIDDNDNLALVDDLVTKFDSKLIALEQVKSELARRGSKGVQCNTVVVVLDREQGGAQSAQANGLNLISLIKFKSDGLGRLKSYMHENEWEVISDYLDSPDRYQIPERQKELAELAKFGMKS